MGSRIFYFLFIFNFPSVIASIKKTGSGREGWNQANITSTFMYNETRHERVGWTSNSAIVPKRKQSKISKSPKNLPACQQYFTSCTPGGVGFGSYPAYALKELWPVRWPKNIAGLDDLLMECSPWNAGEENGCRISKSPQRRLHAL